MIDTAGELCQNSEFVIQTVKDVFDTMLGVKVIHGNTSMSEKHLPIQGAIYFAGGWKGAILIELERSLAFAITANLMGVPEPPELNSDVRDSIGETINMVAGNIKTILPQGTVMSMPSVIEGDDFLLNVIGGRHTNRIDFTTPQGHFSLLLVEVPND